MRVRRTVSMPGETVDTVSKDCSAASYSHNGKQKTETKMSFVYGFINRMLPQRHPADLCMLLSLECQ